MGEMANNMYKVGDCVYFETSSTTPYQIRRIEELCKTSTGNVEAKVMCFFRRRDISSSLITLADKHQIGGAEEESDLVMDTDKEDLSEKQKHQLKHRELFLSRQVETLPATHIRGKCSITLLNETELFMSYLHKEDYFFYSLVYDPQQKTLLADRGEIRVGPRFQAEPTSLLKKGETDGRNLSKLEEFVWDPNNSLTDKEIDNFLIVARSIGTFARSLDCTSSVRQPSLHISAAAASRDITLFHAMDLLHKSNFNLAAASAVLVPNSGPVLCRDEMEEWTSSEANLFEEALDKYGKDFFEIKKDFLPWKSMESMIEYYYMWKTTDRYVQQKRIKASEADGKLKQVYIPNYNKANPSQISSNGVNGICLRPCESCYASNSTQWYSWGPGHMQCRVCAYCWMYWKKYGGLKMPTRLDTNSTNDRQSHLSTVRVLKCTIAGCGKTEFRTKAHLAHHLFNVHSIPIRSGSPSCPIMKTRAAFFLVTTRLTRMSRQLCKSILDIHHAAKQPFQPINIVLIKQECQRRLEELSNKVHPLTKKKRCSLDVLSARLRIDIKMDEPSLSHITKDQTLHTKTAFSLQQKQAREPTSSQLSDPTTTTRKRGREYPNGSEAGNCSEEDSPPKKIAQTEVVCQTNNVKQMQPKMRGSTINRLNGSGAGGKLLAANRSRKNMLFSMDTPEDLLFVLTGNTKKNVLLRKQLSTAEIKRCARKPWQKLPVKTSSELDSSVVVLD